MPMLWLPGPDSGPKDRCFWTTTMMRSPKEAVSGYYAEVCGELDSPIRAALFIFMTCTHSTIAAPELSMQFSIVWINQPYTLYSYGKDKSYLQLYHRGSMLRWRVNALNLAGVGATE